MNENAPYLGLRPFQESEKDKFFGRQHEIHILTDKILAHRLTLLVASSGVGKSSLLQAGVMPALRESGMADLIYHNEWAGSSPAQNLKDSIVQHFVRQQRITADYQPAENLELMEFLRIHALLGDGTLVLLLDQFEEFFYYQRFSKERDEFIRQLAIAIHDTDTPTAFVFSMREDFAMEMDVFKDWYADIFNNIYRIEKLELDAARLAIVEPLKEFGFSYQPELLDVLLKDLGQRERSERVDIAHLDEQTLLAPLVEPPHLQIVCQQLWLNAYLSPEKLITQKDYDKLGGAQGILKSYFNDKMAKLTGEQQRLASRAFDLLVSQHGAKMSYPLAELAGLLAEESEPLQACLDVLQAAAILRRTQRQGKPWYELYHDIFAKSIVQWNQAYKKRQLQKKILQRGGLAVLAVALVVAGNDGWQNYHQRHFRLGKETISEQIEVYQGDFGSWDLFHQQHFLYESDFERQQIEADKRFETIAIAELNQSELMQIGQLPLLQRFPSYAKVGLFENADKVFVAIRKADDKVLMNSLIPSIATIRKKQTIDRLLALKNNIDSEGDLDFHPTIRSLAIINTPNSIAKLVGLLADKDSDVRLDVIWELRTLEKQQVIKPLLASLKDNDGSIRSYATEVLGRLNAREAVPQLLVLLKDNNTRVRTLAIGALAQRKEKEVIQQIMPLLKDNDIGVRTAAIKVLAQSKEKAVIQQIIPFLKDNSDYVRSNTIQALAQIKEKAVLQQIIPVLKDNEGYIRSKAIRALAQSKEKAVIQQILPLLKDNDDSVRSEAIIALAQNKEKSVLQQIIPFLKDNDSNIRSEVIRALAQSKEKAVIQQIIPFLKDNDSNVRLAVINALAQSKEKDVISQILPFLKDNDRYVRSATIRALAQSKEKAVIQQITPYLKDNESNVRSAAINALAQSKEKELIQQIIPLLKDNYSDVRSAAQNALENIKSELFIFKDDKNKLVRQLELNWGRDWGKESQQGVAFNLSKIQSQSPKFKEWQQEQITELEKSFKDGSKEKAEIANDLGYVVVEKAVSLLIPMLKDADSDVVRNAITSLSNIGEIHPEWLQPYSQQITEFIKQVESDLDETIIVKIAAELIATAKNETLEKHILALIKDPNQPNYLRFAALEGLENTNRPEIDDFLLQLLQDPKQDAIEMPVSHLLAKMAYQPAKATMQQRLKELENAKAQWRAIRDNYHYKPTTDNDAVITDDPNAPKAWLEDYKVYQYAYALARIAPASDGIELLNHPLYQARQAAIRALAEKADGNLIKKLVEHHQAFNPEDLPSPLPYSTYQAIDKALEQVEYTGTAEDLAILKQIKGKEIQTQMKDQQRAINERFDWTIEELEYRLKHPSSS